MKKSQTSAPSLPPHVAAANSGIRLSLEPVGFVATPEVLPDLPGSPCPPLLLPRFPSTLLHYAAGLARTMWRHHRRCVTGLLYLDVLTHQWRVFVPAQSVTSTDTRCDCTFNGVEQPEAHHRLAGSVHSLPNCTIEEAQMSVSPHDGMHFVVDPCAGWISVRSFVCQDGRVQSADLEGLIADEADACLSYVLARVRFVDAF